MLAAWLRCAADPQQIQCRHAEGEITYQGHYDQETPAEYEYIIEVNDYTRAFWSKAACQKVQA